MNKRLLTAVLLSVIILGGCIKPPVSGPTILLTKWTYVGSSTNKYDYDAEKRLTIKTNIPVKGNYSETRFSDFNTDGDPALAKNTIPATPEYNTFFTVTYDSQRRGTDFRVYDRYENLIERKVFAYYPTNIQQQNYNPAGVLTARTIYTVNSSGNITVIEYFNAAGELQQRRTFSLFDDQKSIKSLVNSAEGSDLISVNNYRAYSVFDTRTGITQNYTCTYDYNEHGFVTTRTTTNTASGISSVQTFEYVILP